MCTTVHSLGKGVLSYSHANSCHFSSNKGSLEEFLTPVIHFFFPIQECIRYYLGEIVISTFWSLAYLPHVSPLGIISGRELRLGLIFSWEMLNSFVMVSGFFYLLWSYPYLIVVLWFGVAQLLSLIEGLRCLIKILFHQV